MTRGVERKLFVPEIRMVGDAVVQRALDTIRQVVNELVARTMIRAIITVDLISGLNKIDHGLGSAPRTFGWVTDTVGAIVSSDQQNNPFPTRQLWVRLSGAPFAKAELLVY